jgi:hypothetical protein
MAAQKMNTSALTMMKTVLLLLVLVASVAAFAPQTLGVSSSQSR